MTYINKLPLFASLDAPELTENHSNEITVYQGENVTLTCEVKGNPPPVFYWTTDGTIISENTNKLEIIQQNHSAIYTCTATNELGNVTVEINVSVTEKPKNADPTVEAATQGIHLYLLYNKYVLIILLMTDFL